MKVAILGVCAQVCVYVYICALLCYALAVAVYSAVLCVALVNALRCFLGWAFHSNFITIRVCIISFEYLQVMWDENVERMQS